MLLPCFLRFVSDNCTATVDKDYKFYLSFENSLCDQYATEKFWRRMGQNVLPIVMGRKVDAIYVLVKVLLLL